MCFTIAIKLDVAFLWDGTWEELAIITNPNQSRCRSNAAPRQCAVDDFETKYYDSNTPRFAEG